MDYRISIIGLFIGFLVGLTGMGGGALLAPILILVLRVPPVWAVGTDITYSAVTKRLCVKWPEGALQAHLPNTRNTV